MGAGVGGLEIVGVVGPADRRAERLADPERAFRDPLLLREPVGLHLHEVVVLAEDLLVPARRLPRLGLLPRRQEAAHLRVEASGQHEQTVRVLGEQLPVHPGLVVEALQVGLRDQLHEVGMARAVADQHGAVARALVAAVLARALEPAAGRDVQLAAQDRLHPGLLAARVEVHAPEEIAVVGERDGGESQRLGLADELLELGRAVEQAVLRVDVQVDEVGVLFHVQRAFLTPTRWCWAAWTRCRRRRGSRP